MAEVWAPERPKQTDHAGEINEAFTGLHCGPTRSHCFALGGPDVAHPYLPSYVMPSYQPA